MTDDEIKLIVSEAYRRFEKLVITASAAGNSSRTESVITRTLLEIQHRLQSDPSYLQEIVRDAQLHLADAKPIAKP